MPGQTVFFSSHILSEVEALCDRVGILREGRLVEIGTLAEMRHLSALTVEATFDGVPPDLARVAGVKRGRGGRPPRPSVRSRGRSSHSSRPWPVPACADCSVASPRSRNCSWPNTDPMARHRSRPQSHRPAGFGHDRHADRAAATRARPRGPYPGTVLAGKVARHAARSGALWGLIFGLFIFLQTHAYTSTYRTQASRDQLARSYGSNMAMNALLGSERAVNTVAGFASWRFVGILSVLGSIWGLLTATRLMRGEEEAGRYDLLLAGQTTRRRAGGQALAGLGAGLLALFVLTALGAIVTGRSPSAGFSLGQCLYFSVTLVAAAAMFLAIGALAHSWRTILVQRSSSSRS